MKWSAAPVADVPPPVVTVTSTVPAEPDGLTAETEVSEWTVTPLAGVLPKSTAVVPVRWVPVMVTFVPPAAEPEAGLTALTVGTGVAAHVTVIGVDTPPSSVAASVSGSGGQFG